MKKELTKLRKEMLKMWLLLFIPQMTVVFPVTFAGITKDPWGDIIYQSIWFICYTFIVLLVWHIKYKRIKNTVYDTI